MTSQILSSNLTTIVQETKRKYPDVRQAAEQSLQDLKALPSTSEAQLAADLRRRPHFVNGFLAACTSRHAKAVLPGVTCLQRLVVSTGLPPERLKEALEALQECVSTGLDVQLKILQSLPSLLQNYGDELEGELQAKVVELCTTLQQIKSTAVSNTASATLQQTVSSLYEKVEHEDENSEDIAPIEGVLVGEESVPVRSAAFDAYRILKDVCLIVEGQTPQFLTQASVTSAFGLELIESLLLNHTEVFENHPEQADLLLRHVMPLVNRCLSERHSFSVTVRAMRVFCILMREHLKTVHSECEIAFGLLNHAIETETQQPWRRSLCMETFRLLYSNPDLFLQVYTTFDLAETRRNIVQDNLSLFVRLASEKPALIGLGSHSTVPSTQTSKNPQEQAVLEAENAAGLIGSDFGVTEKKVPGVSVQWSSMKVPCLDQLDKDDGPQVPETYIYSLVLTCITQLSDLLAKVVLPTAMSQHKTKKPRSPVSKANDEDNRNTDSRPSSSTSKPQTRQNSLRSGRSRSIPMNPLDMEGHPAHESVKLVASLVNNCWPAVLATSSTFFNAALDAEFYRGLVRSFQKFTQVAGILRLATPRDALLTALSKVAIPQSLVSGDAAMSPSSHIASPVASVRSRIMPGSRSEGYAGNPTQDRPRRASIEGQAAMLTQRNMMCLRALVHLAIALGPILGDAWSIVLDSMQKAHVQLASSRTAATAHDYRVNQSSADTSGNQSTLGSEIAAVESAISKLFKSSADYPSDSFSTLLTQLCRLIYDETSFERATTSSSTPSQSPSPSPSTSTANLVIPAKPQRRMPSVSGLRTNVAVQPEYVHFAISKLGETVKANLSRLTHSPEEGWTLVLHTLNTVATGHEAEPIARHMAADVIARLAAEACISTVSVEEELRKGVQDRAFAALRVEIDSLVHDVRGSVESDDLDVQSSALEALRSILEHSGDAVLTGWDSIFGIANSIFKVASDTASPQRKNESSIDFPRPLSAKLARSSFASIQLICSDFMENVPKQNFPSLVEILAKFGLQTLDINISLTVVTLFWNVSDYLQNQFDSFQIPSDERAVRTEPTSQSDVHLSRSSSAVWMKLHSHLAEFTHDERPDVRNGAVHIIFRALDSCGDRLKNNALEMYVQKVLIRALQVDSRRQLELRQDGRSFDGIKALNNSSKIIIQGTARFISNNLKHFLQLESFASLWSSLIKIFKSYLEAHSYVLGEVTHSALISILSAGQNGHRLPDTALHEVASLLAFGIPQTRDTQDDDELRTQESSFTSYVRCIEEVYAQTASRLHSKHVEIFLERLQDCLNNARAQAYTSDVDKSTELQQEVLKCCWMFREGPQDAKSPILKQLAAFTARPHEHTDNDIDNQGLSFVAFAKQAMDLVVSFVDEEKTDTQIYEIHALHETQALSIVFDSLARPISGRYALEKQGKDPKLWCKAIQTASNVLKLTMPIINRGQLTSQAQADLWASVMRVVDAVQEGADPDASITDDQIVADETFDLDSIYIFRKLINEHIRTLRQHPRVRKAYVSSLFEGATLHASSFDDFESLDEVVQKGPQFINEVRLGRTFEPPFNPRVRMCYSCLDELFHLAIPETPTLNDADKNGFATPEIPEALPALIIRCSIPIKRYIADQPLRGRMPTPMSQRLELLHILHKIKLLSNVSGPKVKADTDPSGWPGIVESLASLINRARELAGNDRKLSLAMSDVLKLALPS